MQASYDEKKRKKSRAAFSDFFSSRIAGRFRAVGMKAAKVAVIRARNDSVLPHADSRISDRCYMNGN
ncbi:hypothetical protein FVF58_25690 [Paraburkholderia panacisoli]|uniref:Uncharacterized protein n=1 Tax=Paraburkholderia panacisoli TaxID=2603818 RepID=A0A5B0GVG3_9BURK|nr:hypothetical protein FVF58_25690 [Paraburkholderia panacisoli]